jgi:uncharacterized membrane protein YtjA (UPF0391 family)
MKNVRIWLLVVMLIAAALVYSMPGSAFSTIMEVVFVVALAAFILVLVRDVVRRSKERG